MPTLFTQIIQRKLPAHIIAEDHDHIAFLDIAPVTLGHTLVVPKKEIDYLFHLHDTDLAKLIIFAKKIALRLQEIITCEKISITVLGLEVNHVHIHLIPVQQEKDLNLNGPRLSPLPNELADLANQLKTT